jgi:hypothetical protein
MRSPGYVKTLQWMSEIWYNMDPELIRSSFGECGVKKYPIQDNKILVDATELHSVLSTALKKVFTVYIDDDLTLHDAMDQMDEDYEQVFAQSIDTQT